MTEIKNPPNYRHIDKNTYIIDPEPQPEPQPQQTRGPVRSKGTVNKGPLILQNIPIKHSDRRALSLEEMGKEKPGSSDFLYGIPGASIIKSRERHYNTETGCDDLVPIHVHNCYHDIQRAPPGNLPIHKCGGQLYLYPVSLDIAAEYYLCKTCNVTITIQQRDEIFQQVIEQTKSKYQLKELEWSAVGGLRVESSVFIGEHRLVAKRKSIKSTEKNEIYDYILRGIQLKLGVSVDDLSSLFKEEPDIEYHI